MEKIIKWIMRHKKSMIVLIIAIILFPIIAIHLLFKLQSNCYWIEAEWNAGEILGYFGDVLAFVGTVVLGYIAIAQTEKANHLNNELLDIEKNRIKPHLDISSMSLYKIYLEEDMKKKLNEINRSDSMIVNLLYTNNPPTGNRMGIALIELEVTNSGFSDINRILFVKSGLFYLSQPDPGTKNEKIASISGNTRLKVGEIKKFYIYIEREISCDEEQCCNWYKENSKKLLPHIEFEFNMETVMGNYYIEELICGSNWNSSMENTENTVTRAIGVVNVTVNDIKDLQDDR